MSDVQLYNGDCLEVMKDIPDGSIDLCITDPPYWHKKSPWKPYSERKQCNTISKFSNSNLYSCDGDMMKRMSCFDDKHINEFMSALAPKMKIMNAYVFCSETQVPYYTMWAEDNRYMFTILVWEKPLSIINKNRFSQNLEYIIRIYDYGTALNRLQQNDFYNRVKKTIPIGGTKKLHPTEKPVSLINEFLQLSSNVGDIVFDPFTGSGTTGVACVNTERNFIGIELDEEYFRIAKQRINETIQTNKKKLF